MFMFMSMWVCCSFEEHENSGIAGEVEVGSYLIYYRTLGVLDVHDHEILGCSSFVQNALLHALPCTAVVRFLVKRAICMFFNSHTWPSKHNLNTRRPCGYLTDTRRARG